MSAEDPVPYSEVGEQRYREPSNATHHRVYLPGPHGAGYAYVIDHPPSCDQATCDLERAIRWQQDHGLGFPVQGEYFTTVGINYERCAWQPRARVHPWEAEAVKDACDAAWLPEHTVDGTAVLSAQYMVQQGYATEQEAEAFDRATAVIQGALDDAGISDDEVAVIHTPDGTWVLTFKGTYAAPAPWWFRVLDILAAPQNWIYR